MARAYRRDSNTGILLPDKGYSRRSWHPDNLILRDAVAIPTSVIINGYVVDNVLRHLSGAPGDADGVAISPYKPAESAIEDLPGDTEAMIAGIESMLRGTRHEPPTRLSELPPGAEMVRAITLRFVSVTASIHPSKRPAFPCGNK